MVEPVERAVAGQRLSAPESFGVSTLEPGQRPPTMPPGRQVSIRVQLLDDTTEVFNISQRAPAKALFDLVCAHLNLAEGDYFSLEYQDQRKMMVWLDLLKPILKQIRRPKNTILRFVVKFFPPDHTQLLEELTRYLFALQIKHDLACGRLTCNDSSAALLISHIIQSEIGDFDEVQSFQHLLHNKYIPDQDVLMDKITEYHRKHVGQTPAESDYQLLEIARRLEMYGVRLHPAKDREGTKLSLAVSHTGVLVFQGHTKINAFNWSKVRKLSFKRKRFLIKLRPDLNQSVYQDTLEFIMASRDCCKIFWKICVEYHAFFRLFEEPRPKPKPVLFTRGSSFRFSGRTQKQVIDYVKDSEFKKIPFERKHSKIISTSSLTPQERKRTQVPKESASADLTDSPLRLTLQAPVDNPSVTSGNLNGHRDGSRPEDQGLLTSATRNQDHQIPGPASRAAKGSSSSIPFIDCSDIDSEHEARASHTHHNDEGEPLGVRGQRADTNGGGDRVYQSLQQEQQQGLVGRNRYREPRQLGNNREVTDDELSNTRSLNGGSLHGHSPLHSTLLDEIFHGGNRRALQDQRSQGYLSGARSVGSSPVVNSFHQRTHSLSHTPGEPNGHVPRSSHWNDGGHSFSRRPGSTPLFGLLAGEVPHQYGSYSPIGSRSPHLAKRQNNLCNRSDTDPFILSQLTFTPVSQVDRAVTSSNGYNQLTIPGQARANEVQRLCGRHGEHGKSPFPQMIDGSASSGTDTSDTESDTGSSSFGNQPLMYGNPAAVSSSPKVGSSHVPRSKFLELDDAEQGFNFSAAEPGARVFSC